MVGLFHLGNKGSPARVVRSTDTARPVTPPPPPYTHNGSSPTYFATETTTTTTHTVTTTQTTTHFFSLPLWLRRPHQQPIPSLTATPGPRPASADELGLIHASPAKSLASRDKDLPPTPFVVDELGMSRSSGSHLSEPKDGEVAPTAGQRKLSIATTVRSVSPACANALPESSSQGTAALARAALGLGLPPLMFNSLSDQESPEGGNVVSFATPAPSPERAPGTTLSPSASMGRVKSFQRESDENQGKSYAELSEQRRVRGLSLGPLVGTSDNAAKDKPVDRKPLSRKSSFWSRKRNDSHAPAPIVASPSNGFLGQSTLPSLLPVSPFNMEASISEPSSLRPNALVPPPPSDLRRRHSEKVPSSHTTRESEDQTPSDPPQSPRRRRSKRPTTAGSATSPRAVSTFFPGSIPTEEPVPMGSSAVSRGGLSSANISPTSLRPRSSTNPPFLHRLSINLFGSSPSPSPVVGHVNADTFTRSPSASFSSSSRPSLSRSSPKVSVEIPRPRHDEESPEIYLQRLLEAVSKAEVANVLAATGDDFHAKALRAYLARFDFGHDPLDVALRRLLMDVGLPRETQQIDRVMEAFAERYRQSHPTLFVSEDHPYILAFSLIMLHTDAFNKSNKRKMTKADYIKNTRLPGVAPEVLDCFYDNIVFAPFIFIEDPVDVNGQRGLLLEGATRRLSTLNTLNVSGGLNGSGSTLLGKNSKVDPYYLITRNLLDDLRVDIHSYIPLNTPYFYQGTGGPWDDDKLLRAFATANVVEVASESRHMASPWFNLNVGGAPSSAAMMASPAFPILHDVATLKVTKVGPLQRKDEYLEGGRKANPRKWKEWSVLLTGSQLLFSRDPNWAAMVQSRSRINAPSGPTSLSQALLIRPDEMLSLRDAVAVYDHSYTKHANTLRLVMSDGRHYLLQAKDEDEMNEWISCINYAATFKTAGVRMRSMGMSGKDIELTGEAAAVSHLRDIQHQIQPLPSPRIKNWDHRSSPAVESTPWAEHSRFPSEATAEEPVTPPMENSSRLFKATFDQVKAELASGGWRGLDLDTVVTRSGSRPRAYSLESTLQAPTSPTSTNGGLRLSSRSQIIYVKVRDLETKLAVLQSQLDSDMRFVKNVAVLTPFQRATRDRLQLAVQNVAKRIMQIRLDLEKLRCHRDVLIKDLEAEERDWQRTKNMALRAATAKLELEHKRSLPRMTLSTYMVDKPRSPTSPIQECVGEQGPQSAADSFHSAVEFSTDYGFLSNLDNGRRLSVPALEDSPVSTPLTDGSASPYPDLPKPPTLSAQTSVDSTTNSADHDGAPRVSHEKFYTAHETAEEQAEEWNKTRAAKRVSLVRLPSDLRMSALFGKHTRNLSQVPSDDSSATTTTSRSPQTGTPSSPFARTNSTVDNVTLSDI